MSKKNKTIITIICIVAVIVIIIGLFFNSISKDREKTNKIMNLIVKDYDKFEASVLNFNDKRDKIYSSVFEDTYYDTIKQNYDVWNNSFNDYEKTVDDVISKSKNLKKYCANNYYSKNDINSKCSSFSSLYEEVINSFVSDINSYNKLIDTYNEYVKENSGTDTLNKYSTKKKFIDFNNDGDYAGKE